MKHLFVSMLVIGLSFSLTSCSNKKVKNDDVAKNEVVEESLEIDDSDFVVDAETESLDMGISEEPVSTELVTSQSEERSPEVMITGSEVYEVQKGETLMWIAFKLYGDYRKWKDLRDQNQDILSNGVMEGAKLKYTPSQFVWNPQGLPHLIRKGETLGTISSEKYGTSNKWKSIWDNNRDMIKDPNLIFAGFTLYYIPADREIASDNI